MEYKLGELCNITSSKRIYRDEYVSNGIPFYRGKEIIEKSNNQQISNELFITKEKYKEITKKYGVPQKGDILITAVGTIGISYLVNEEKFYFKDGNLIWIKDFNSKVNNEFLNIYFKSLKFKNSIEKIAIGSTQKAITIVELKKMKINIPNIDIQNKVVNIYRSIQDKIELNNQINDNLSELNNTLYEEIFINQRQKNWKEYNFYDLANVINGYSYKGSELVEESNIGLATIKNFERKGGFKKKGFKCLNPLKIKDEHLAEKFDILVACTDLTQSADIIGNAVLLLEKNEFEKIIISMDLVKIIPKENINKFVVYSILNSKEFKKFALGYKSGTTVLHLNKNCFKDYKVQLPAEEDLNKFSKLVEANYSKMANIMNENSKLEQLRDTLLPKLMNGEINLDKIEI